ncbi:MAG: HNH endonuclease [Candidatus Heimdallarchaeaceae archaeon]
MEKIYLHRTKIGKPLGVIKWELFRSKGKMFCNICGKDCSDSHSLLFKEAISNSNMDHIIPVFIGGSIRDKNNLQILCRECYSKKSSIDRRVIKELISKGLLIKRIGYNECENIEKLIIEYKKLFEKFSKK